MMIFGMLYFDSTYKLSEAELIKAARKAFERRCDSKASLAILSISAKKPPEIEGLLVTRSHLVFPHHTIVGVPAGEKQPEGMHRTFKLANPNAQ